MNSLSRSAQVWDKAAFEWDQWDHLWQDGPRAETLRFFAECAGEGQLRVLDHGCGPGESTRLLKELGYDAVGVDISPKMVDLAQGRGVEAYVSNSDPLPFADGEFDAVFACASLEWCPQPHKLVREFVRVVKPGGVIVAATLGANASPRKSAYPRLYGKPVVHNMLMPWELHRLLQEHGLEIQAMNGAYPRDEYFPPEVIELLADKWTAQAALATLWAIGTKKQL